MYSKFKNTSLAHGGLPSLLARLAFPLLMFAASVHADNVGDSLPPQEKPPCKECDEDSEDKTAGDPVWLHSGEFYWYKSFFKPVGSSVLGLTVRYSSFSDAEGVLGSGWVHNFQYRLVKTEDNAYAVRKPMRKTVFFEADGVNEYRAKENSQDRLYVLAGGSVRLRTTEKEEYLFDADGKPVEISYPSAAKKLSLSYDSAGKLPVTGIPRSSSMLDPMVTVRDWRLTTVSETAVGGSPTGRRIDFVYDANGHLERVQNESNTRSVQFVYAIPSGALTTITDEIDDSYQFTYYDTAADRSKPYWRYIKTFSGQGCADCAVRTNLYESNTAGTQQAKLTRQMQGVSGEGERIDIDYSTTYATVTYTVKNTSTGLKTRERTETINFTSDAFNEFRVLNRTVNLPNSQKYQIHYTYNPTNGKVDSKTYPSGGMVSYIYDARRNITKETHKVSTTVNKIVDRDYDARNNPTKEEIYYSNLTGVKFTTERTYNGSDQMTMEKRLLAANTWATTSYTYFPTGVHQGLLQTKTDPRGNVTNYEYTTAADAPSPVGLLKREYDPQHTAHQTTYTYDASGNCRTVTDALGRTTTWEHDNKNRVVREIRPDLSETVNTFVGGNLIESKTGSISTGWRITRYRYNGINQRDKVYRVNNDGQEVLHSSYEYDSEGKLLKVSNSANQSTIYEYNLMGWRTKIKEPYSSSASADATFFYDKAGRLVSTIDSKGAVTEIAYDYLDRKIAVTVAKNAAEQSTTERSYDVWGNVTEIRYKDAVGNLAATTCYYYDLAGRRTGVNWNPANAAPDPGGAREFPQKMEYDQVGNLTAVIDGRGNRTTHQYDSYSRRKKNIYPDRLDYAGPHYNDVDVKYDEVGNVLEYTDGRGTSYQYRYDSMDRKTHESVPTSSVLAGEWWNTAANLLRKYTYNCWGELISTNDIVGGAASVVYDKLGRQVTRTNEAGLALNYIYDAMDQPIELIYPPIGASPSTKMLFTYDASNGSLIKSVRERSGNLFAFAYDNKLRQNFAQNSLNEVSGLGRSTIFDARDRPVSSVDEIGRTTKTAYDLFGQIKEVTFPDHTPLNPRIQSFTYSPYGRLLTQTGVGDYPLDFTYDLAGNQLTMTAKYGVNNINQTTTWSYDVRNRVKRKTYQDGSYFEYTYDQNGNMKSRRDAKNKTTYYSYNLSDQVEHINYPTDADVTFTYDALGRRISMTDGSRIGGPSAEWVYDAAGRVTIYKQHSVDRFIKYDYNPEGGRISMEIDLISAPGSPWFTYYTYDGAGRLDQIKDSRVSNQPFDYGWDGRADLVKEILMPSGAKQQKWFDATGRLSQISAVANGSTTVNSFAYTSDVGGRRKDVTLLDGAKVSYGYQGQNQLASAVKDTDANYSYSYSYDGIGNWLSGKIGQLAGGSLTKTFSSNAVNQYSVINGVPIGCDANGSLTSDGVTAFAYDEENRLVTAGGEIYTYDGLNRRVGIGASKFLYDDALVIAQIDSSNAYVSTTTRGLDILNRAHASGGIGDVLATVTGTVKGYYFYDGDGNVVDILDDNQVIIAHYVYDPFGNKIFESGTYSGQPYQWSTKEFSSVSGLVYYLYRYYNSAIGRWMSRDPSGEIGGVGMFSFVHNLPGQNVDYLGLNILPQDPWTVDDAWNQMHSDLRVLAPFNKTAAALKNAVERDKRDNPLLCPCDSETINNGFNDLIGQWVEYVLGQERSGDVLPGKEGVNRGSCISVVTNLYGNITPPRCWTCHVEHRGRNANPGDPLKFKAGNLLPGNLGLIDHWWITCFARDDKGGIAKEAAFDYWRRSSDSIPGMHPSRNRDKWPYGMHIYGENNIELWPKDWNGKLPPGYDPFNWPGSPCYDTW